MFIIDDYTASLVKWDAAHKALLAEYLVHPRPASPRPPVMEFNLKAKKVRKPLSQFDYHLFA